ncbi:MFS transporter [Mycoplasmopsis ciconiae]|uniref:MFS transporter n=1 Tax=Mycoplasmopsis ciconiae TaxID=561067 RepID=A0ABU7ML32_9BACT|nr:MFS transporter [Mycoplasmopsis ciconiae]
MENVTLKQKIKSLGWKKIAALVILACLDLFIIALPYYMKSAIPNFYQKMHVEESVLLNATAIIGWVTLLTQIPGGWLADKYSNKKLLLIGVALTFIASLWFAALIISGHNYQAEQKYLLNYQYYAIFFIWGISTTPFFWSPLWKLVSQQTTKEEQGLAYGIQGAFVGLIGFVFTGIIGFVVLTLLDTFKDNVVVSSWITGSYMLLFSFSMFILWFALLFFVKENKSDVKSGTSLKSLAQVLSDWKIWALAIFLLGMYTFQSTFSYYLNQLLAATVAEALLIPASVLTIMFAFRVYGLRLLVGGLISKVSDRFKSFILLLIIASGVGIILVLVFMFMPGIVQAGNATLENPFNAIEYYGLGKDASTQRKILFFFLFVLMNIIFFMIITCSWIMVTLRYAQQGEIYTPKNSYGTVTAVFSLIGFSSDAWLSQIGSVVTESYKVPTYHYITKEKDYGIEMVTDPFAYQIMIIIGCAIALIGILAALAVYISNVRFNKKYNIQFSRWREVQNA